MRTARWRSSAAVLVGAAMLVATTAVIAPPAMASNRPAIMITSPTAGWTSTTNSVTVDFAFNRAPFQIASQTCSLTPSGSGDVVSTDCTPTPATAADKKGGGAASHASTSTATFKNLANGTYTFTATATLTDGGTATASETITVKLLPPAYVVSVEAVANTPDGTHPDVLVVPQFTDPLGFPLTVDVTGQPENGTVTKNADGTFTYTPNATAQDAVAYYDLEAMGAKITGDNSWLVPLPPTSDHFTLTADDGHGGTVSHTVTVPISPYYNLTQTSDSTSHCVNVTYRSAEDSVGYATAVCRLEPLGLVVLPGIQLDTSYQFPTDSGLYVTPPTVPIGSCSTDPTNANCATPPPPVNPAGPGLSAPPLPLANFYGVASGQTFLKGAISGAVAAVGVGTVAADVIYGLFTAAEVVFCAW